MKMPLIFHLNKYDNKLIKGKLDWYLNSTFIRWCTKSADTCNTKTSDIDSPENLQLKKNAHGTLKEMYQYLKSTCSSQIHEVPSKYLRRSKKEPDALYIVDNKVAGQIINKMRPHINSCNSILEMNPGLGILTQHLVDLTPHLLLYEPDDIFFLGLMQFQKKYKQKIQIYNNNIIHLSRMANADRYDNGHRIHTFLSNIPRAASGNGTTFQIVGALSDRKLIWYLIHSLMLQDGLMACDNPEFYLCIPKLLYTCLTATPDAPREFYQRLSVLFQLAFHICLLDDNIPRKAFIPWMMNKKSENELKMSEKEKSKQLMYLVKISKNKDFMKRINHEELLRPLWYFVRHYMRNRSKFVIPTLELVVPGCGVRLVTSGYGIYTQFGELSSDQIFNLFLNFTKWPEYSTSSFLSAVEDGKKRFELTFAVNKKGHSDIIRNNDDNVTTCDEQDPDNEVTHNLENDDMKDSDKFDDSPDHMFSDDINDLYNDVDDGPEFHDDDYEHETNNGHVY